MDITQPAREPVTYHADSHGGFYTTSLFWDCSCDEHYIHPFTQPDCPACGDCREEAPEARVNEVLRNAYEWRLDKELVHQLEEAFPASISTWSQAKVRWWNSTKTPAACRMTDWLEAVYEDRISGWNDDF